ncbi:unnamed protein product [Calypogeia fissa]
MHTVDHQSHQHDKSTKCRFQLCSPEHKAKADKVAEKLDGLEVSPGTKSSGSTSDSKPEEVKKLPGGKVKKKTSLNLASDGDIASFNVFLQEEVELKEAAKKGKSPYRAIIKLDELHQLKH